MEFEARFLSILRGDSELFASLFFPEAVAGALGKLLASNSPCFPLELFETVVSNVLMNEEIS